MTDLTEYYKRRKRRVIRDALPDNDEQWSDIRPSTVSASRYFDRLNDSAQIQAKAIDRFATGIVKTGGGGENSTTSGYEQYRKGKTAKAVETGKYETVSTGIGSQIASETASLFTSPGLNWQFRSGTGEDSEQDEEATRNIAVIRRWGGFESKITALDFGSVCLLTTLMHIGWKGDRIFYDILIPDTVFLCWGDMITEEITYNDTTESVTRRVDKTDIEDASAVILCTGQADDREGNTLNSYLAYVGSSVEYPDGRMVSYLADKGLPLPKVGSSNIINEHARDGSSVANPLTYLRNNGKGKTEGFGDSEYPIVIFSGGSAQINADGQLMPISTELHKTCIEIELSYGNAMRYGSGSARGKNVITQEQGTSGALPENLDDIALSPGQSYQILGRDGKNSVDYMSVLKDTVNAAAAAYGVPGFILSGVGIAPASGVSLAIQLAPMRKYRDRRIKINRPAVQRIFEIEKSLLAEQYPSYPPIPADTVQLWDPGAMEIPQTLEERIASAKAGEDGFYFDHIQALMIVHNLATREEAIALDRQYSAEDSGYESTYIDPEEQAAEEESAEQSADEAEQLALDVEQEIVDTPDE